MRLPQDIRELAHRVAGGGGGALRTEPSAVPLLAASLARAADRRLILVAPTRARMEALQDEVEALMPGQVVGMAPWLASPYVVAQGDRDAEASRLGALARFLQEPGATRCLVVTAWEWLRRQPAPAFLDRRTVLLVTGELVDRTAMIQGIIDLGYGRVEAVSGAGQIAVRGGIIDIFPAGASRPVRVDLFGDEIESLAHFDQVSQAAEEELDLCVVPPARLVPLDGDTVGRLREGMQALAGELRYPSRLLSDLVRNLQDGQRPPELEVLYPLGVDLDSTVASFGDDAVVVFDDLAEVRKQLRETWDQEWDRYKVACGAGALVVPPDRIYRPPEEAEDLGRLGRWLDLGRLAGADHGDGEPLPAAAAVDSGVEPVFLAGDGPQGRSALFAQEARRWMDSGLAVVLLCERPESMERTRRILGAQGLGALPHGETWSLDWLRDLPPGQKIHMALGAVERGFVVRSMGLVVTGEADLFGKRAEPHRPIRRRVSDAVRVLSNLDDGDLVVHTRYGIGRFLGLETKAAGGHEASFLALEYADRARCYVPVHHADRIQRYIGSDDRKATVDKLGGAVWEKRKTKAREAARKLAFDLIEVYAKRHASPGHGFAPSDEYFEEFEASFQYDETPDQARAIREVLSDMERPSPMDRLVCGDVGFGKTEVAVRAAFKAVLDGKQVAVLVPTTVLAEQHRRTFEERFEGYPVRVESLSRFKTAAQQREILKDTAAGKVDILIGTHRILSKDVVLKSVGLLVVDEEHRFGVGHKETLRAVRETVDVLSMTATPIPRTLHMAMAGIRDISVIASAPEGRRAVETQVIRWEDKTVARAIRRELERDGQVFVLHNSVQDLGTLDELLRRLVPEARVGVAHGQMNERGLEKAMLDFGSGRYNVLLCTTIIESGLDLPRVNTLIINNAHRFGLAQLYQIRGRVGRSDRQAYAYFIVPPIHAMTQDARQRLAALQRYTDPGSGFTVATMDLEIRGAGDLFGASQSGHMAAVGYDLFTSMLEEAVRELRGDEEAAEVDPEIRVPIPAHIPDDYLPDPHGRLILYRRIAGCRSVEELAALAAETEARYGPPPPAVDTLFGLVRLKVRCRRAGIALLEVASTKVRLDLSQAPGALQDRVLMLLRDPPAPVKMDQQGVLEINASALASGPLGRAEKVLDLVTGDHP
ncbi:MAG: transcription-repair coupling factor [Pseudomonadota bacterium]